MPSFVVTMDVGGDFPPLPSMSPIKVTQDLELVLADGQWSAHATIDAADESAAIEEAKRYTKNALTMFQIFLSGSSTPFSIFPREDHAIAVDPAPTGTTSGVHTSSIHISARISAQASAIVASNIAPSTQKLQEVLPVVLEGKDCEVVLYYYARANQEKDEIYKFLDYVTVVESMLSESPETTEKVARRLALLVSSTRTDMQMTYENFKGYYDTRSRILHGDKIPSLTRSTIDDVSELARLAAKNYFLMRRTLSEKEVRERLDKFLDPNGIDAVRRAISV